VTIRRGPRKGGPGCRLSLAGQPAFAAWRRQRHGFLAFSRFIDEEEIAIVQKISSGGHR